MFNLYAPKNYWTLSPEAKKELCNGCGTSKLKDFIPNTIWFLDITEACKIHDYMYHVAEPTIEGKNEADRTFLNNMIRIIYSNTKNSFLKFLRRRRAYLYYDAVSTFGGPAFWNDKNI